MQEIWKDIPNYEGLYQISNLGNVKSFYKNNIKGKKLKFGTTRKGYLFVILRKNKKGKLYTIHRLVALTFIPNPHNYLEINHKDENKKNNRVDNLEWCTHKYNANYGTMKYRVAEKLKIKVNQYDLDGNYIKTWNSLKEASEKLNIKYQGISKCCRNLRPTAYGFKWKYKEEI